MKVYDPPRPAQQQDDSREKLQMIKEELQRILDKLEQGQQRKEKVAKK